LLSSISRSTPAFAFVLLKLQHSRHSGFSQAQLHKKVARFVHRKIHNEARKFAALQFRRIKADLISDRLGEEVLIENFLEFLYELTAAKNFHLRHFMMHFLHLSGLKI
jgi:hypothetical protein